MSQNLAANEQSGGIVLAATKSGSLLSSSFLAQLHFQNHIGAVASRHRKGAGRHHGQARSLFFFGGLRDGRCRLLCDRFRRNGALIPLGGVLAMFLRLPRATGADE